MITIRQTLCVLFLPIVLAACSGGNGNDANTSNSNLDEVTSASIPCDATPERMLTAAGVEFVRTPDACFDNLVDFPYESEYVEVDGLRQAYIEDGPADGEVVLLLHGQPSWSYLYRKMIPVLANAGYRVIAMDHLGTGRSDKPTEIDAYTYLGHSDRLEQFIGALGLADINLFVQDWGSLIGLRVAGLNPEWFASIAVGDGALPSIPAGIEVFPVVQNPNEILDLPSLFDLFPDQQEPYYDGCDTLASQPEENFFGGWMEYAMKAESFTASEVLEALTWFPLSEAEEAAYDAPFPSREYMAGIRKFPSIINEVGGQTDEALAGLAAFEKPFITIWASNDPGNLGSCAAQQVLIDLVPGAAGQEHARLPESSHFLQDDQGEEIARRLVEFIMNPAPPPLDTGDAPEPPLGFELLQLTSENEIIVWVTQDITLEQFDALELPEGWIKNQPRTVDTAEGSFSRSPNASEDGPLTEAEWFGYTWRHNATIVDIGIAVDEEGLLNAVSVAKYHTLSFDAGTTVYVLISPDGDQYLRVSRDEGRTSEEPTIPDGWQLLAYELDESITLTLPNPTLNIRADNQDSFQGPVEVLEADQLDPVADIFTSGPLPLTTELCEDPANMDVLLESPIVSALLSSGGYNDEQVQRMLAAPTEGPFYNFNLIRFRELAVYEDGRETNLTGREANALYAPIEFLAAIGARAVFATDVDEQIDGDAPLWDEVAIAEYPCPIALFAMLANPDFQARLIHKTAAIEETYVLVALLEPSPLPDDFTPPEGAYPPTMEDPAFQIIHVKDFYEVAQYDATSNEPARSGAEAWELYSEGGRSAGLAIGSVPTATFTVQGVLSGDDRSWDEIDILYMPSMAGFEALLADETRLAVAYHRAAALENNYSLITYPLLNNIPGAPGVDAGDSGSGGLPITERGVGTVCTNDTDCADIGFCLSDGIGPGFCSSACGAGECGEAYTCCHSCSAATQAVLPFTGSACLPSSAADQLTAAPASCSCE